MIRGLLLVSSVFFALIVSCGKSAKRGGESSTPSAGENGAGETSTGGFRAQGGTTGAGTAGSDDGGEPSEGGARTGGSGGSATGGASSGGSSTAGAAGAAGVRLPDGCDPVSQQVGGTSCSFEMTCDTRRLNVSCSEVSPQLWSCSCSGTEGRVDYEVPATTGLRTCEAAVKACADPDLLTGDETCVRTHTQGVLACTIQDTCERAHEIDGVTLRTRTVRNGSCGPCLEPRASCCSCEDELVIYRVRDIDLSQGCDFLDELCKVDGIDPIGAVTCEPLRESMYNPGYGCELETLCGQPVELGDGTRLTLSEDLTTYCLQRPEGLRCVCSNEADQNVTALDFGPSPGTDQPCRATSAVCSRVEPLEPIGSRECTPNIDIVLSDGCTLYLDCVQQATAAGAAVTAYTNVGAQCEPQTDGTFICYCNNRTFGPYEIEAGDTASACSRAIEEVCPTLAPTL